MELELILNFLTYSGLTPDKLLPVAVVVGAFGYLFNKNLDKKFNKVDKEFSKVDKDLMSINRDLICVNNATTEIQNILKGKGERIMHPLTMKPGSPLVMTDYGKKLVNESGFPKVFEQNRNRIVNAVKSRRPQTNYDIQEYSKEVLLQDFINDPMMKPVKDYAYQNSLGIKIILETASLTVRDEVMKEVKFDDEI